MSDHPLVSIIIPVYNCRYIAFAIESALNQTYANIEVVVINDGSSPEYSQLMFPYMKHIVYVEKENGGVSNALNCGISHSRGTYFTWLSADDLYFPTKVERQLQFLLDRQAAICYGPAEHINDQNQKIGQNGIPFASKIALYDAMLHGNPINGCTVLMKKDIFDQVGRFDESLKCTQDYDLWCRILPIHEFHYCDEPLVQYRIHSEMSTKRMSGVLAEERGRIQQKYAMLLKQLISDSQ